MNAMLFLKKSAFILFVSVILISCSKENISDEMAVDEVLTEDLNLSTSTVAEASSCSETFSPDYGRGQVVINSKTHKTLSSYAIQSSTDLTVQANYEISLSKDDLPATVTITIGESEQVFKDVHPGSSVSHSIELPTGWEGGDVISYSVEQKTFLEPVKITRSYVLTNPCPVELGTIRFGGLVAHIFQPGEVGYVEGETHGIILSTYYTTIGMYWYDAVEWANNLEVNGFRDWTLPTIEDLEKTMVKYPDHFVYDPITENGVWSSTEYEPNPSLAYGGTKSGGQFGVPREFTPRTFSKQYYRLIVRAVRYF